MKTLVVLCSVLVLTACSGHNDEVISHLKEFRENCSGATETTVSVYTNGGFLSAETSVKCIEEKK